MAGPLTEADIIWRDGIPHAAQFDDLYYAADDPVGEVRHTFLDGTDFDSLCRRQKLTIGETGFGTGLNFFETCCRWLELASPSARLSFISAEAYPMPRAELARAHDRFPALATLATELRTQWPGAISGHHRLTFADGRIRLFLLFGDAAERLADVDFQSDAWFLDGFAPARNPEIWHLDVLQQVARLSRPGTRLASFTAAGSVRRDLAEVGFRVEKRAGFGRKRNCLTATFVQSTIPERVKAPWTIPPTPPLTVPNPGRIAVIGNGIAGATLVRALRQAGCDPIHIGGHDPRNGAASTLPQALIAPNLVRGEQAYPGFVRQAYLDAARELDQLDRKGDIWQGPRGVLLPAFDPETAAKQAKLLAELCWPETELQAISAEAASSLQGYALPGGLYLPRAGSIDPAALRKALCEPAAVTADIASLRKHAGGWELRDTNNSRICDAETVILATGPGTARLLPGDGAEFGLRTGVGQLLTLSSPETHPTIQHHAILADGYITTVNSQGHYTAGATTQPWQGNPEVDPEKTLALLDRLKPILPRYPFNQDARHADAEHSSAWAGLRCDTTDHLPICGPIQDITAFASDFAGLKDGKHPKSYPAARYMPGLYTMAGLGARGFQSAFLLADHLTSLLTGAPSPLSSTISEALAPGRFQIRGLRSPG